MITKLTTALTMVTDRIEEANASIQEIDKATTLIADFTDAVEESGIEFIKIAEASKAKTRKDAKAMKLGVKKLQQKLTNTKDQLMIEIRSTIPSTIHVEGTQRAIQNECHKGIAEVRAEKDRNMAVLNDKSQSLRDKFHKLTFITKESISKIAKEAINTMDITLATVLNQSNRAVESVIEELEFKNALQQNIAKYTKTYPREMEVTMNKFTEEYYPDNDTLEYYIRTVARSVTDVGNINDQIEEQVIKIATEWMNNKITEAHTTTAGNNEDTSDDDKKKEKKEDEYRRKTKSI
jgi:hypothetical protein